jgi:hypothetical protein
MTPEERRAARREREEAELADAIRRTVAEAPPMSPAMRDDLRLLIHGPEPEPEAEAEEAEPGQPEEPEPEEPEAAERVSCSCGEAWADEPGHDDDMRAEEARLAEADRVAARAMRVIDRAVADGRLPG